MAPIETDILVLGAGPGGYTAAFYAADKGRKVTLVEQAPRLGGVCLNRGCIPSKALLHATKLLTEARESAVRGIHFEAPKVDLAQLRAWKESILDKLATGIRGLAKGRDVRVMQGRGYFEDSSTLRVETADGQQFVKFKTAIVAVGSKSALPKAFDLGNPRIMTSRQALELEEIPPRLLIVGGGYIGMELGTVYTALGSRVVMVEAGPAILASADQDLIRPVIKYADDRFEEVRLSTRVADMATQGKQIKVTFAGGKHDGVSELFDRVLISVGRVPNHENLGLENTKVRLDEKGFIKVNEHQRTDDPNILAIGDIAGGVLLAHKASKEARIAVDVIAGGDNSRTDILVPAVVFTDPEVAWVGLTEEEAKQKGIAHKVAKFPWSASGRAMSFDRTDGLTKLIIDPESERVMGVGITGHGAGELIAEGTLAIEMGATAFDLASTIHPHPTLSETLMECAEAFYGHATHTMPRKSGKA